MPDITHWHILVQSTKLSWLFFIRFGCKISGISCLNMCSTLLGSNKAHFPFIASHTRTHTHIHIHGCVELIHAWHEQSFSPFVIPSLELWMWQTIKILHFGDNSHSHSSSSCCCYGGMAMLHLRQREFVHFHFQFHLRLWSRRIHVDGYFDEHTHIGGRGGMRL